MLMKQQHLISVDKRLVYLKQLLVTSNDVICYLTLNSKQAKFFEQVTINSNTKP